LKKKEHQEYSKEGKKKWKRGKKQEYDSHYKSMEIS
jgi:hypothetical protein